MSARTPERRGAPRLRNAHGIVTARVRSGHTVNIVDVSAGGVLVDTTSRLLPGASVDLQLERTSQRASCRGQITRCAVVKLRASSVHYRAAVAFEKPLAWFQGDLRFGYSIPNRESLI